MDATHNLNIDTKVDVSQSLRSMNKILKRNEKYLDQLNKINRVSDKTVNDTKDMSKATEKYSKEISQLSNSIEKTNKVLKSHSKSLKNTDDKLEKLENQTEKTKKETESFTSKFSESLKTAVYSVSIWGIATTAVYGFKSAMQEVSRIIIEVNTEMINLQKVMNPAITNFQQMKSAASGLGIDYAKNIKDVIAAMVDWGRQGRRQNDVIQLTKASLLASNVAEMDAAESVRYLTSAILQFNINASNATGIVDKWNNVSNNFATQSVDLAESIKESGAAAHNAGISIDELIGMTTALTASTGKSGNRIGNALKTIFSRIRGDTNSTLESLGKVEDKLNEIGIALRVNKTTYRDTTSVLTDLASKWDSLNGVMKDNIARAIGGRRRYSDVISLMENWDIALDATKTSMNSLNSAMEENKTFMEGLKAQIQQARSAAERFSIVLGKNGLNKILLSLANSAEKTFTSLTNFTIGLANIDSKVKRLIGVAGAAGIILLIAKVNVLRTAITALVTSINPYVAVTALAVGLIAKMIAKQGKQSEMLKKGKEKYKELNKVIKERNELTSTEATNIDKNINKYSNMIDKYGKLSKAISNTSLMAKAFNNINILKPFTWVVDVKGRKKYNDLLEKRKVIVSELRNVFQESSKLYDDNGKFIDAVTKKIYDYQKALRNSVSYIADQNDETWKSIQQHRQENEMLQERIKSYNKLTKLKNTGDATNKQLLRRKAIIEDLQNDYPQLIVHADNFAEVLKKIGKNSAIKYNLGGKEIEKVINKLTKANVKLRKSIGSTTNQIKTDLESRKTYYANEIVELNKQLKTVDKGSKKYKDLTLALYKATDNLENVKKQISKANAQIKENQKRIQQLKEEYGNTSEMKSFYKKLKEYSSPLDNLKKKFQDLIDKISEFKTSLKVDKKISELFGNLQENPQLFILKGNQSAYQTGLNNLKKTASSMLEIAYSTKSKDSYIKKIKEDLSFDNMTNNQQKAFEEFFKSLSPKNFKSKIEKKVSELVNTLGKTYVKKIKELGEKIDVQQQIVDALGFDKKVDFGKINIGELSSEQLKSWKEKLATTMSSSDLNKTLVKDTYSEISKEISQRSMNAMYNDIFSSLNKIAKLNINDMPLLNGKTAHDLTQNFVASRKAMDKVLNVNPNNFKTIDTVKTFIQNLKNAKMILRKFSSEDLKNLLGDPKAMSKFNTLLSESIDKLKKLNEQQKQNEINSKVNGNYLSTLSDTQKQIEETKQQLNQAKEYLSTLNSPENIFKQNSYIDYLINKLQELQTKAKEKNFFDNFNDSLKKTKELLNSLNIDDLSISGSNSLIGKLENKLSAINNDINKVQQAFLSGNISENTMKERLKEYGLTKKQIKNTMKELRKHIISTKYSWAEAIGNGISNAFKNMDNASFGEKLTKGFQNILSTVFQNKNMENGLNNFLTKDGKSIFSGFGLSDKQAGGVMAGLKTYASTGNAGKSLFSGLGYLAGGPIGSIIGSTISSIFGIGEVGGKENKAKADKVNEQITSLNETLAKFGMNQRGKYADVSFDSGFLGFGGDWEVDGLNRAKKSLEELKPLAEKLKSIFSTIGSSFAQNIKEATSYSEFASYFKQSIGQALQDALVSSIIESDVISKQLKKITGQITNATSDSIVTDKELKTIQQTYDNIISKAKSSFDAVRQLQDSNFMQDGVNVDNSQSYSAGSTTNITYHRQYVVEAGAFMGTESEAETFAEFLEPYIREVIERNQGN